jgi:cytochrome c oxidase subunit 1
VSWIGRVRAPLLWAIGAIVVLAMAGLTDVVLINANAGHALQDTYFVVAHNEYALILAAWFSGFAGWYYLYPKITGYAYSEFLGKVHFWLWFIGSIWVNANIILAMRLAVGVTEEPETFQIFNLLSWVGSLIFWAGMLIFLANMVLVFVRRQRAD